MNIAIFSKFLDFVLYLLEYFSCRLFRRNIKTAS